MSEPHPGLEFHDALVPALRAGSYRIEVETEVHALGAENDRQAARYFTGPREQPFRVRAPRWTLPGSAVHAVYPPPTSTGTYDQALPHVALDRAALPWEVDAAPGRAEPWLAVLLFATGELPCDPEAVGRAVPMTVRELLASGGPSVLVPDERAMAEIPEDEAGVVCDTVDVPSTVFAAVAPKRDDLPFLTHVRRGGDEAPAPEGRAEDAAEGRHAVVIGNRFPSRAGGQYVAHLVSLEGCRARLEAAPAANTVVRLITLRTWSFRSLADVGPHFGTVMEGLAEPGRKDPAALALRAPAARDGGDEVSHRRFQGFHPVRYGLRTGEHTIGWYRGPLSPVPPPRLPDLDGFTRSGDARLIYLPETGMFDVSHACAWSIGRAVALADAGFGAALMRWRNAVRREAGRRRAADGHGSLVGAGYLDPGAVHERFRKLVERVPSKLAIGGDLPPLPPREADAAEDTEAVLRALTAELAPVDRLMRLARLEQVPFDHLVPDPALLPPESLRFFYVDRDWLASLLAGAVSAGVAGTMDARLNRLLHAELSGRPGLPERMSGFLVRSVLAASFPALRLKCWGRRTRLTVLRRATVAPGTVLVLVDGVLDELQVAEPPQGLQFGYEVDHDDPHGYVQLRRLTGDPGARLDGRVRNVAGHLDENRVVRVREVVAKIQSLLTEAGAPATVTPGGLGVHLVRAPQQITFTPERLT